MTRLHAALLCAVMIAALVICAVIFRIFGLAYDGAAACGLPEPTYTTPAEIILMRAEAPERANTGLVTYETFGEALERTKAAVPDELAELAGRAIWGEAGGIQDEAQRAAVVWCACNRADAWDVEIGEVPEQHVELARDVLARWTLEAEGWQDVGRVLPSRFLYFEGNGVVNLFSTQYGGGEYWHG